jgi:hypothetical protein
MKDNVTRLADFASGVYNDFPSPVRQRPANTFAHAAQTLLAGISLVVSVGSPILPFLSFALRSVVSICKTTTREEVVLTYFTAGQDPHIRMSMKLAKLKIFEVNPIASRAPASPSSDP